MNVVDLSNPVQWIFLFLAYVSGVAIIAAFAAMTQGGRAMIRRCASAVAGNPMRACALAALGFMLTVYGGTKPPPVIVEKGIVLEDVRQDARQVSFRWTVDDSRIKPGATFVIQNRINGRWYDIGATTEHEATVDAFTIDKTSQFRIMTDITLEARGE